VALSVHDPQRGGASDPGTLRILSVAPNPFTRSTEVLFEAVESGPVSMEVYDVAGRHVNTAGLGSLGAGRHRISWDGRGAAGAKVASGVYFLRLRGAGGESRAVRVLLAP